MPASKLRRQRRKQKHRKIFKGLLPPGPGQSLRQFATWVMKRNHRNRGGLSATQVQFEKEVDETYPIQTDWVKEITRGRGALRRETKRKEKEVS